MCYGIYFVSPGSIISAIYQIHVTVPGPVDHYLSDSVIEIFAVAIITEVGPCTVYVWQLVDVEQVSLAAVYNQIIVVGAADTDTVLIISASVLTVCL